VIFSPITDGQRALIAKALRELAATTAALPNDDPAQDVKDKVLISRCKVTARWVETAALGVLTFPLPHEGH